MYSLDGNPKVHSVFFAAFDVVCGLLSTRFCPSAAGSAAILADPNDDTAIATIAPTETLLQLHRPKLRPLPLDDMPPN